MNALRETERVADLSEWAIGEAGGRHIEYHVVPEAKAPDARRKRIDETLGNLGITIVERLRGGRPRRFRGADATALVETGVAQPGIAFLTNAELIQHAR